jgi:sulfatase maturation enzyme AslB (radical SAM superfamily)
VLTTGGRGIDRKRAFEMAGAGLFQASVSIDGLEATHDLMRASRGSFASARAAVCLMSATTPTSRWSTVASSRGEASRFRG